MSSLLRIAIGTDLLEELRPAVEAAVSNVELVAVNAEGDVLGEPRGIPIWVRSVPARLVRKVVEQLPDLRWIHTPSAGVDHVLYPELIASDIIVTNGAGAHAIPISETVLGMLIAVAKRLPDHWRNQQAGKWERYRKTELYGATLVVVGTGHIGRAVAERGRAFGMRTVGITGTPRSEPAFDRLVGYDAMSETLSEADYVVVAAALGPATRRLIGGEQLACMKATAWLVNIARGDIVDEDALIAALRQGQIGGAYLDVFEQEPLPADSPLWTLPNVHITPHNSAFTDAARGRGLGIFVENVQRWVTSAPLVNVVDKQRGY